MEVLLLNDLLRLSPEESACAKVRFNQHNGTDDPMELYKSNPDKVNVEWLFWKTKQRYLPSQALPRPMAFDDHQAGHGGLECQ